ncbi:MAG: ATP-binding protein [Ignavibacteriae bacterium]|nr:MAG: ATP-binding protein [Ignavibacteriota bacterium]
MNKNIPQLLELFKSIIKNRLADYFQLAQNENHSEHYIFNNNYFIKEHSIHIDSFELDSNEKIIFLLALIPNIIPGYFDSIIQEFLPDGGDFPEFGGVKSGNHRGMLPTGETVQFILAGNDIEKRIEVQQYFSQNHFFHKNGILWLESMKEGEPAMSGRLVLAPEWIEFFLTGNMPGPSFSPDFPAKLLTTRMEWKDLIIHTQTSDLLCDIKYWLEHHDKLYSDKNLSPKIKPGYRVLFYGPPGTGKTLTASLLGKEFNKPVYRIDLSLVVSKYIGETEKNLNKVFDKATNKEWILFFDEADALFAKRTNVSNAHDKYANQEVSYLLQKVEDFQGLIILASNFKSNIDEAFTRRFNTIVHFPKPDANDRLQLWNKCIPFQLKLDEEINLEQIAIKYELTGAMIVNVMQYASIRTFAVKEKKIKLQTLLNGIGKEFQKEEKSF